MFMREEDQVKTRSLLQLLIIINSPITFALFYFQLFKQKMPKNPVLTIFSGFVNLASYWCLITTTVSWDTKLFVNCYKLFEE
jgi:hypothetical protein